MNDLTLKNYLVKPLQQTKIEFWAATTIFVFALFSLSTDYSPNRFNFDEAGLSYDYYEHYFFPQFFRYTVLYLSFLLLNFKIVPKLIQKERLVLFSTLLALTFIVVGFIIGIVETYTSAYQFISYETEQEAYDAIFLNSYRHALWLLLMFGLYTVIKYSALYLLSNSATIQSKYRLITRDALTAFVVWMVSVFLLLITEAEGEVVLIWGISALCGIALYCYSFFYLIPKALNKKHPLRTYLLYVALIACIAFMPVAFLLLSVIHSGDAAIGISLFNVAFQLLITAPLSWVLFKRHLKGNEEVYVLQKELGRSNANLDFLRSQINPHFLFNALNTLYGTALQENSERTAQGIQMLGDMMRFMLHENHQQKILLSREIEYLRNYIDLQLLRTSASENIAIQTKIEDVLEEKYIAPMLLIPFVENAFKHGISLKHKSWIRVTMHVEQNKLYFDVYNSTHAKSEKDPEKDKSGIGLANVKQRLKLLYPDQHELIIRETPEEYFVHLTVQLHR